MKPPSNRNLLWQYLGFAVQLLVMLALALYGGMLLDRRAGGRGPLFVWILPLVVIIAMIVKAIKDTSKK